MPACSIRRVKSLKFSICLSVDATNSGTSGASATAKWLHWPTICSTPSLASGTSLASAASNVAGVNPLRPKPESTFTCTRAVFPRRRAAAATPSMPGNDPTEISISLSISSSKGTAMPLYTHVRMWQRSGPMPALRSSSASCDCAVPSQVAPPASAASAAGIRPCPYASALTTPITAVPEFGPPTTLTR
ncbi:unknown [Bifidobacterium pseudocatenulatum CAG:263]|nr:unknown [Bifidobacterium pseudocatenulatum CAG:263]